ncbi:TraB/GumN family protein [Arsukibacterium sp.]|uniref:TraB/GumN family protein n=1 Tax=Arsukibacterium sp. TaxID=1977258 RepID=UPI001BD38FD2|nr:TraB/GumN family protein [Arsukibacterium sp.]
MNPTQLSKVICVCIALFSSELWAKSFVWQVSHGEQHLYIGGTAHLLPASQFPLPAEFDQAYQQAEKLVFEADISQLAKPSINSMFMSLTLYQDGHTLNSVLSAESYQHLQETAAELGIDINTLAQYKPDFVLIQMMQRKLTQLGIAGEGVDDYFFNKATQDGKSKDFLETIEQHLVMVFSISDGVENEWVAWQLNLLDDAEQYMQRALTAWRSGNREALAEMVSEMLDTEIGHLEYQRLLSERNKGWVDQIDTMLQTPEIEFVLVGAMHLAGPENVLDLLAERGYQVRQLSVD